MWGLGSIFDFPTASSSELGTGRWSAGPTAALVYSEGPWLNYILTYQLMSFGGNRARGSVNQTYIEPEISYALASASKPLQSVALPPFIPEVSQALLVTARSVAGIGDRCGTNGRR